MTGMQIVREETMRMLRGMVPLALIAFGVFVLAAVMQCVQASACCWARAIRWSCSG